MAKEQFNPLDKTNGMSKLVNQNRNTINTITTQDAYDYKDILKKSRDEAFKGSTKETTVKPDITTRQEAQDEADRMNQIYQAVLGVKEGFMEKICDSGGTDALSLVLQQANGQTRASTTTHCTNWRKLALREHTAQKQHTFSNKL